jgi:hypothetical protein
LRGQGWSLLVAFGVLLVGAVMLKGAAQDGPDNPTASAANGAPRGLLALHLWLEARGARVSLRHDHGTPLPEEDTLLIVPPPEASPWTAAEVDAALERVAAGTLDVLVVCDEDRGRNRRLGRWLRTFGVTCESLEGLPASQARGTLPGYPGFLHVRGTGRLSLGDDKLVVPAWVDERENVVVARKPSAGGSLTLLGTATVISNDGLAKLDNAAFLQTLMRKGVHVVLDEAHHRVRGADAFDRAFSRLGPRLAGIALLLLIPAVLFGFAPRKGDAPPAQTASVGAARAQAGALAALYRRVGARERKPIDPRAGSPPSSPT